jgi:hypothetical protein
MELPFQPCVDKSCKWGGRSGNKWRCCCDPAQYNQCSSGGDRPEKNTMVAQNTSTNKQMVEALKPAHNTASVPCSKHQIEGSNCILFIGRKCERVQCKLTARRI